MSLADHDHYTHLLRTSSFDLWVRLRNLLRERGLDPASTVLVNLFPDGGDHEFGRAIAEDGRVYRFDLFYDRDSPQGARKATIRSWTDITDTWQAEPLHDEIAQAFIWAPPPRRTDLTPRPASGPLPDAT
ncbi:hypothetical protein [Streptomyces yangpuensis]|uniref:hypothetical protein n=1 Tax=Streptomyces yangpuensis TaxID=1648182 RepID=UPI00380F99F8